MTPWEHRTVVVDLGDDGPVTALGAEGWEPYAAMPAYQYGGSMGSLDIDRLIVALRRPAE